MSSPIFPSTLGGRRCFRLFRVIRLMKSFSSIRIILETLLRSLPQLANVILLLLLVYRHAPPPHTPPSSILWPKWMSNSL